MSHFRPQSLGFDLLARSNYHWQLSFSRAEHLLMEGLDEDGGCRMRCFRVMRQMKEDVWCAGNKPVITAYHLQVGITMIPRYGLSICCRGFHPVMSKYHGVNHSRVYVTSKVTVKTAVPFHCFTVARSSVKVFQTSRRNLIL